MRVPGEALKLGKAPDKPEGAKWAEGLEVIDRVSYRADGGGYARAGYDHVFVVPADGGAARQVTFGNWDDSGPLSWSPDGRTIVFSANRRPDWEREANNSEVYAVDVAGGTITPLTNRNGPDNEAHLSPDGKHIAYLGYDDVNRSYENTELYVMNADGSGARSLTAGLDQSDRGGLLGGQFAALRGLRRSRQEAGRARRHGRIDPHRGRWPRSGHALRPALHGWTVQRLQRRQSRLHRWRYGRARGFVGGWATAHAAQRQLARGQGHGSGSQAAGHRAGRPGPSMPGWSRLRVCPPASVRR